jgi:hypothetical protein
MGADSLSSADATRKTSSGCHALVDKVYSAFPREIRDMIWMYLYELEANATANLDLALYSSVLGLPGERIDDENLEPWFVQFHFMGVFARREMLELRYRHCFTIFHGSMLSDLHRIATVDPHKVGLIPIRFVQKVRIRWKADEGLEPLRDPEYWPTERFQPTWKACFDALRQIRHKGRFDMELRIKDRIYGMGQLVNRKHFAHLMRTFRPVYTELKEAGARIRIYGGDYIKNSSQHSQRRYP